LHQLLFVCLMVFFLVFIFIVVITTMIMMFSWVATLTKDLPTTIIICYFIVLALFEIKRGINLIEILFLKSVILVGINSVLNSIFRIEEVLSFLDPQCSSCEPLKPFLLNAIQRLLITHYIVTLFHWIYTRRRLFYT